MRITVLILSTLLVTILNGLPIVPVVEDSISPEEVPEPSPEIEENTVPPPRVISPRVDVSVDVNEDGVLDIDEIRYAAFVHHGLSASVVEDLFKQVDTNRDNVLDAREFDAIRMLVLEKAENAALRYLQNVDTDRDGLLSLQEAQIYLLREYGIGYHDVARLWKLVPADLSDRMNSTLFSKLRRRVRGMTIRLARQIMKNADLNGDGHISVDEAQAIAFEQEGIGAGDVASMVGSVDENMDGELNAPEFADFERIIRARAIENSKKAMRVVDADNSGTLTLDEAKRVAFEHYGFDEATLAPFFGQADENEDGQLDNVEFAGFRSVIRARSVRDAMDKMKRIDTNGDGLVSNAEATDSTKKEDDMDSEETLALFNIADQNKSGKLDKVELADFNRLVRLSSIKFATDHFKEFDLDGNDAVTFDEIALLIEQKYGIPRSMIKTFFDRIDVDGSGDLMPAEIVDFRHLIRNHVSQQRQEKPPPSTTPITTTTEDTPLITTPETTITPTTTVPEEVTVTTKKPKQKLKPVEVAELIDGIANDVIAQDILREVVAPKATVLKTTVPTTTVIQTTETPSTKSKTTKKVKVTTTTVSTTTITTSTPPSTTSPTTTVTPVATSSATPKPSKRTTTRRPMTASKELVVEEIIYEDENGNRMNPKKRKSGKADDVSYEEIIEYVDEPATN
ncbi:EF-hand domain-containing protein [Caenorhabditis elegans]|uniref:EF-hand domain-containing protein n=1 Tax=Caenorhabditis elegans TaxID=6239 RepID=H2KY97_CAEEL|nr:EF-hand domain-containing protein [Caenorhabditis elegans]CCD61965.1 EF-hand domain-containing protein [Caenorhabditis elegans]|eukprot:NP_001022226.1 Calcium BiNding protein homolog [Caenorhabditis elegans]